MKMLKRIIVGLYANVMAVLYSRDVQGGAEQSSISGPLHPVEEQDEWSRLTQDLMSSDPRIRALARSKWNNKRSRNAAFFDGIDFPEKPEHLRNIPMNLREGWGDERDDLAPEEFHMDTTYKGSLVPNKEDLEILNYKYPKIPEELQNATVSPLDEDTLQTLKEDLWKTVGEDSDAGNENQESDGQDPKGSV